MSYEARWITNGGYIRVLLMNLPKSLLREWSKGEEKMNSEALEISMPVRNVTKDISVAVDLRIVGLRGWAARLWLAQILIRLGALIAGFCVIEFNNTLSDESLKVELERGEDENKTVRNHNIM